MVATHQNHHYLIQHKLPNSCGYETLEETLDIKPQGAKLEISIPKEFAINGLLVILSIVVIFHLLVLTSIIPYQIVWGGRLQDASQMMMFETVSIALNLFMLAAVAVHARHIKISISPVVTTVILWIMFVLFLINTVGNLFSNNQLEKIIFTPLTFLLAVFSLRAALK